jgi:WD40 repeat protein/serine/threonine protein kinase
MTEQSPAEAIFFAALDKGTPEERAAYLDAACGDDHNLRQRVERLLAAHPQVGHFLEPPAPRAVGAAEAPTIPPPEKSPGGPARAETVPGNSPVEDVGAVIAGRYKLLETLGQGGMGAVFMAQQTQPVKRVVALKLIKLGMDSKQVLARFEAERQALALMDHPNIAKVLDAGTTDSGRPFFVMELVKGVPITRFCDERQLSPRQRLELFIPVCQAIQHAHQKGIIHRDIKPTNVLVALYDDRPVPKVIDFGVAKAAGLQLSDASLMTGFGSVVGTPEYMSPEQAQLNQLDIDTRSDVYALGVLLYELLTGTTPIDRKRLGQGALFEVLRIIREEEPPRPSTRLSTSDALASIAATRKTEPARLAKLMRGELDWIVMKCLEKDRSRRYETANGLAHDIERYLADEPVEACPPSSTYRLRKFAGKYKKALATAAVFVVLLAVGAVTSTLLAVWATSAEHDANRQRIASDLAEQEALHAKQEAVEAEVKERQQRQSAERAEAAAMMSADDAVRSRYVSDIQLADQRFEHGDPVGADAIVRRYAGTPGQKELRGWEWYYQERLCHQELRTLKGNLADVNGIAFSPDGKRLATAVDDRTVRIWDVATGQAVMTLKGHARPVNFVLFSPNGKRLATAATDHSIRLWDAQTGAPQAVLHVPGDGVHALAFSPDGARLGSLDWNDEVRIWDAAQARSIRSEKPFGKSDYHPVEGRLSGFCAAFSADLNRLAIYEFPSLLFAERTGLPIWDATTGETSKMKISAVNLLTSLGFSPDGRWLATCSEDAPISFWNVKDRQAAPRQFAAPIKRGLSLAFTPDAALLACGEASGRISIWQVRDGKLLRTFAGHNGPVKCLAFNLDGGRLASGSGDGTAKLWDTLGTRLREVPHCDTRSEEFSFSSEWGISLVKQLFITARITTPRETFTGQAAHVFSAPSIIGGFGGLATSRSGQFIGAFDPRFGQRKIAIWDTRTGAAIEPHLKTSPDEECRALFFQPEDTCRAVLEVANRSATTTSLIVAPVTSEGVPRVKLELPPVKDKANGAPVEVIGATALSFDGTRVAIATGKTPDFHIIAICDLRSGSLVGSINDLPVQVDALRFTGDGRLVARCGRRIYLCNISKRHNSEALEGSLGPDNIESMPLTISPDDRLLAAADGEDIAVWNLVTGKRLRTIHGGSAPIGCLAFNPNGSRLAAGTGRALRLWDMTTGQELRSLTGHTGTINAVAFSSDGYRLISASDDQTVRVYDARPMTPELQTESEASSLCESLATSASSEPDLIARIGTYPGVADAARRVAEELAPQFWDAEVNDRAVNIVGTLLAKTLLKADLLGTLRSDKSLGKEVRDAAINRASHIPDDPERLNSGSRQITARADASSSEYRVALRAAEEAVRLSPENFDFISTLGAALYRVKSYGDAIATLSRSNEHHSKAKDAGGSQPADLAFLAMAHHALGHAADAQAFFRQLTELLKQDKWKLNDEARALFEETKRTLAKKP